MLNLNPNEITALHLIRNNCDDMSPRAETIFNAAICHLLRMGLIDYAASRRIAYKLTSAGQRELDRDGRTAIVPVNMPEADA